MTKRATVFAAVGERVLNLRRHERAERPRPGDDLVTVDAEGELALEPVEGVVLGRVRVGRRPAAVRLDRDDREVEAGRVRAAGKKLDVPDPVTLARSDHDCLHVTSLLNAPVRASTASVMSSGELSSSGLWLIPPLRLRTKSMPEGMPADARMPASWPAPDGSSTTGSPEGLDLGAKRAANVLRHRRGLRADPLLDLECSREAVEPLGVGRARIHADDDAARDDVRAPRLHRHLTDGRNGAVDPACEIPRVEDELSRLHQRVLADVHRRRSGVSGRARERAAAADVSDDPGDDAQRHVCSAAASAPARCAARERIRLGRAPAASRATSFLVAEDHDPEPRQAECLDRLETRDDAEGAVEPAGAGNRVEV